MPPEYIQYEVLTPLGAMTVQAPPEPSAEIRQDRGSPPVNEQVRLFIPHDAICLEESPVPLDRALSGRKSFNRKSFTGKIFQAPCSGSFFNGPNLIVKLTLPASKPGSEEPGSGESIAQSAAQIDIIASPRIKTPAPGSMVDLSVDESLLRFVRAENKTTEEYTELRGGDI